jgi:hypothetical protein
MLDLACELPDAASVVGRLLEEFDAPSDVLRRDLEGLLDELAEKGLISRRDPPADSRSSGGASAGGSGESVEP